MPMQILEGSEDSTTWRIITDGNDKYWIEFSVDTKKTREREGGFWLKKIPNQLLKDIFAHQKYFENPALLDITSGPDPEDAITSFAGMYEFLKETLLKRKAKIEKDILYAEELIAKSKEPWTYQLDDNFKPIINN